MIDALPIFEENNDKKYKSKTDGKMRTCGRMATLQCCLELLNIYQRLKTLMVLF